MRLRAQERVKEEFNTHSIQAGLSAREGESEAQREASVLHAHVVQEVADTLHNVIKQLEEKVSVHRLGEHQQAR